MADFGVILDPVPVLEGVRTEAGASVQFALADNGTVVEIDGGLTTHAVLPQIAPTCCCTAMVSNGSLLIALTYFGEMFSTADPAAGWTSKPTLPSVAATWRAMVAGPSGTTFVATDRDQVFQVSADFSSNIELPRLPVMHGLTALATNEDASQLVAITYEGRLYSRPTDDAAAPWTERLTIPRVRDF